MRSVPEAAPVDAARALAGRAVRGSMWAAAGAYTIFLVNFGAVAALAHFVAPAAFGSYALALAYTQVLSALGLFPFGQAVVQSPRTPGLAETALRLYVAVRGGLLLLAVPAALAVRHANGGAVAFLFLALAGNDFLDGLRSAMGCVLERDLRYRRLASTTLAAALLGSGGALLAARLGLGAWALVLRDVLTQLAVLATYVTMRRRWELPLGRAYDRRLAGRLWRFARNLFWIRALDQVLARLDRVVLGNVLGLSALGLFHQAKYLAMLPQSALAPASMQVAVSTYSKVREDRARLGHAFDLVQYVVLRVVPLAGLALALFPEELLSAMYGARWLPAAPALRVLGVYATLSPILESYRSFTLALERWRALRWSSLAQLAVLVIALAILAPRHGTVGAAVATCLVPVTGLLVLGLGVTRRLAPGRRGTLGPVLLAIPAALAAGLGVQRLLGPGGGAALLALKLAAAALAYGLALLVVERRALLARAGYLRARAVG